MKLALQPITNFGHGKLGELAAADYLKKSGFEIVEYNYRTKICEIDIVAKKSGTLYFIEVKYRVNQSQGDGIDYITKAKINQMILGSRLWLSENKWEGDCMLAVLEVSGADYTVTNFLTDIIN